MVKIMPVLTIRNPTRRRGPRLKTGVTDHISHSSTHTIASSLSENIDKENFILLNVMGEESSLRGLLPPSVGNIDILLKNTDIGQKH